MNKMKLFNYTGDIMYFVKIQRKTGIKNAIITVPQKIVKQLEGIEIMKVSYDEKGIHYIPMREVD